MKQQSFIYPQFTGWFRFASTLLVGVLLYVSYYFINPEWFSDDFYLIYGSWAYLLDLASCILGCYILSTLSIYFSRLLDALLPWNDNPLLRICVQMVSLTVLGLALILLLIFSINFLITPPNYVYSKGDLANIRYTLVSGGLLLLFFNAIYTGVYFFRNWRNSLLKAEAYKRASLLAQFEALKAQVDPHFLFNTLSTLTTLIEEDPPKAIEYVDKLSQVYRYVLQVRNCDKVYLSEEIAFLKAYLFLASIRFGDSLRMQIELNGVADSARIPPMTLQILLENALKHNVVSPQMPLIIRLEATPSNGIVMRNILQPKSDLTSLPYKSSTGMGLENILNRYRHLGEHLPKVAKTKEEFIVSLPLL